MQLTQNEYNDKWASIGTKNTDHRVKKIADDDSEQVMSVTSQDGHYEIVVSRKAGGTWSEIEILPLAGKQDT